MMKLFRNIFGSKRVIERKKYNGLADFLLHASPDEQKKAFEEAARKANEDQMKVFKQAQLKTQTN